MLQIRCIYNVFMLAEGKVLPDPQRPMGALISISIALSQISAEAASPRTQGQCVARSTCLASSLRRYQFILLGEQRHICVNDLPGSLHVFMHFILNFLFASHPDHE